MLRKSISSVVGALTLLALMQPAGASTSCHLAALTKAPELGTFYGRVVDSDTGEQQVAFRASEQTPSASVLKVLTGISALIALPAKFTVETKVYLVDNRPDTIVLQGAGDPTLSRLMPPSYSTYPKPARLPRLAALALAHMAQGAVINHIIVDDSYFNGPAFNPNWKQSDRTNGYVSPIVGLEIDGARLNPDLTDKHYSSVRVSDPESQAVQAFKTALGQQAANASVDALPKSPLSLTEIASVTSSPIESWVDHAMKFSDNTEVEFIARQVSKWMNLGTSYTSIQRMVEETMANMGVSTRGLVMHDASGLAANDRVTPKLITDALRAADVFAPALGDFSHYLATSTSAGTLSTRFKGANKLPDGAVQAKTGFIPGLYSLAGYVNSADGHRLVFAFFARGGRVGGGTRTKLHSLVVRAFACGARLTN